MSVRRSCADATSQPRSTSILWSRDRVRLLGVLAIYPSQKTLLSQLIKIKSRFARQLVLAVQKQIEAFREQRPFVQPLPFVTDLARDRQLGVATFGMLDDLRDRAAQELHVETGKQAR